MAYNFDYTPNRRDPKVSNKWTLVPKDALPMWVADMDFQSPQPILKELHKVVEQGVLGYELPSLALQETVAARMDRLYGWKVKPETVLTVTGIVSAFSVAARAFDSVQNGILIQTPVYNEFHEVKNNVGIPQFDAPMLRSVQGNILHYEIDWDVFRKQAKITILSRRWRSCLRKLQSGPLRSSPRLRHSMYPVYSVDLRSSPIRNCAFAIQKQSSICGCTLAVWDYTLRGLHFPVNVMDG